MNQNIVFTTLARALEKQVVRSEIPEGTKHTLKADVRGTLNDESFQFHLEADTVVGMSITKASSVTPATSNVLAYILELIALAYGDAATQEICGSILQAYQSNGLKNISPEYLEQADALFRSLRTTTEVVQSGPITVKTTQAPVMSV